MTATEINAQNKGRIFYGWFMLPVAVIAQICTGPGQSYGLTHFYSSFETGLSLSNSQITGAYMCGTLVGCLPLAYVGGLIDRRGIRWSMTLVVVMLGIACLFASQITGLFSLFLAFLFLRMLGQASLSLCAANILPMWFRRKLGIATGLKNQAFPLSLLIVPQFNQFLILELGWRNAFVALGALVWVIMLPILGTVFRNSPEEIEENQDGELPGADDSESSVELSLTLDEARKERSYWILLTLNGIWGMVSTAIIFCAVPLIKTIGFEVDVVSYMFTTFAFSSAIALFLGGILVNRIPLNILMSVGLGTMTVGTVILLVAESRMHIITYALWFGGGQGLLSTLNSVVWVRYFGRDHLGSIRGRSWRAAVAGSAVGPFVMGLAKDCYGTYQIPLTVFAGLMGLCTVTILLATEPVKKHS
jgi:MFS family permease